MWAGSAALSRQAGPSAAGTPSGPAGQPSWTEAPCGDALTFRTAGRAFGSTWNMYWTVPPGGTVASVPPTPAARGAPAGAWAIVPGPATAGIAHRNKVAAQP